MTKLGTDLVRVALRDNPRRRHLLVSTVLGKHIPVPPADIFSAARSLGEQVTDEHPGASQVLVAGFAETATGLAEAIADGVGARYVFVTTRYSVDHSRASITEAHSHAPRHDIIAAFEEHGPFDLIVVVDDELTTGATATALVDTIRRVRAQPAARVVIAALVDSMSDEARVALHEHTGGGGVLSLARVDPAAVGGAVARLTAAHSDDPRESARLEPATRSLRTYTLPRGSSATSRRGWTPADRAEIRGLAREIAGSIPSTDGSTLVLGTEEAMWLPQLVADSLAARGASVLSGSTTRSPVLVRPLDDYPVRDVVQFRVPGWEEPRFVHNVGHPDRVVLIIDDAVATSSRTYAEAAASAVAVRTGHVEIVTLVRR